MVPTRPWNATAGQHYAKFITKCASPLTLILLDDSITGDNGRGKVEGNRVLDLYASRADITRAWHEFLLALWRLFTNIFFPLAEIHHFGVI